MINEDGEWEKDVESTLPQEEPDFDQIAQWEREDHEDQAHGGKPCDCPVPTEAELKAQWEERAARHRADEHGGGECDCVAPF